jgi:hypothetical protein
VRTAIDPAAEVSRGDRLQSLDRLDLITMRGSPLPILRDPPVLSLALGRSASATILGLLREPTHADEAATIFARSPFGDADYATVLRQGRSCIQGPNGHSVLELAAIAHELGHCLHESRYRWDTWGGAIASETAALLLEEAVVGRWLANDAGAVTAWGVHRASTDVISYEAFDIEHREALGVEPAISRLGFPDSSFVARPTYLGNPGYETVYALATALSAEARSSRGTAPPDPDATIDAILAGVADRRPTEG